MNVPGFTLRGARVPAALIGAALTLATLLPSATSPAQAWGATEVNAPTVTDAAITASLTTDNGGVLTPDQNMLVSVTVTNQTDTAHASGSVELWLDPNPQKTRNALTTWLDSTDSVDRVNLGQSPLPPLEQSSSVVVRVIVPAAAIPFASLPTSAVYGIGASVDTDENVTETRGSVVWHPGDTTTPSNVSVVMPIISPSADNGLISAQDIATYTAPNGVLTRDLDGIEGHSTVAIGIDPMIIASIRALGNAAPATATAWLTRLSTIPNDTFALAFGDSDVTGQIQAGLPAPLQPTTLNYAIDPKNFTPTPPAIGESSIPQSTSPAIPSSTPATDQEPALPDLEQLLFWDYTLTGMAWPGDHTTRAADLSLLAATGIETVIVSGDNTNSNDLDTTPNASSRSDSTHLAVSDQRLSEALRQAVSAPNDLVWNTAISTLNTQLELVSAESASPHHILIALDRSWPSSGTQLLRTLDALFSNPWSTPSTLPTVLAAPQTTTLALTDSPESRGRIDAIQDLLQDETALGAFATILTDPATLTGRTRAELLTLLAVSWQNPHSGWNSAVTKNAAATVKILDSVRILPTENINLVSAQGSIPFTVSNESDETITVVLNASPSNGRLEIDQPTTKTIPKDSRATMLIPVKAKVGNGQVILSLQLHSPTGVPIGEPSSVTVDVHADWEGLGALILGGALILLFSIGLVRNILRRRNQRRKETTAQGHEIGDDIEQHSVQRNPPITDGTVASSGIGKPDD